MTREIRPVGDEAIRAADVLLLVDPEQPVWQQLLWSAPLDDGAMVSATLEITEIPIDSRDEGQITAARERVSRLKGGTT